MFSIKNSTDGYARIEKELLDDNFYCNFVNKTEILVGQKVKYSINIVSVTDSYLLIGFCSEKGLGNKDNYNHAESVYYNCRKNGYLKTGGKTKELSDCGSRNGDLLECRADLKDGNFIWRNTSRVLEICRVPEVMLGKPIYLSILLLYPGNKVDVKFVE